MYCVWIQHKTPVQDNFTRLADHHVEYLIVIIILDIESSTREDGNRRSILSVHPALTETLEGLALCMHEKRVVKVTL